MAVLVIGRMQADRDKFERVMAERADDLRGVAADAKAAGALHHRFGVDDSGLVVILDEWESTAAFQKFFDNPTIATLMQDAGVTQPPEFTIVEALSSADQF